MAAQKQYRNPLKKGDTVRIVGDVCHGLVGELKVIDPEQEDECFFGIQFDLIEGWIFFSADEIERVENVDMAELPDLGQEGSYGDYRFSSLCPCPERRAGHYQRCVPRGGWTL